MTATKMPRKKKSQPGRVFTMRLRPPDEAALEKIARRRNRASRGAVIRDLLHEEAARR